MRTTTSNAPGAAARLAAAGLAGVLALGVAGCGGGASSAGSTSDAAAAVASPTGRASSSPGSFGSTGSSKPSESSGASGSSAATRPARSAAELSARVLAATRAKGSAHLASTTTGGGGLRYSGVMRVHGSGADVSIKAALPGGQSVTLVAVGGALYMNVGQAVEGKHWVKVTPGGSDPLSKALAPALTELRNGLDINAQVPATKDAKITAVTRTELGGVATTKYTLVSSVSALLAKLDEFAPPPEVRAALRKQFAGAHVESVVWVDDRSLPLRVDSRVVGGAATGAGTTTMTYSRWGEPVKIVAPPRGDVAEASA
jgi:hypothetical protein